jgi:hypothetical protein
MSPRTSSDAVEKRETPFTCQETNPGRPARRPYWLSYPGYQVYIFFFARLFQGAVSTEKTKLVTRIVSKFT